MGTTFIDELIGWKRLLINGVEQVFRNRLNITGAGVVAVDNPITGATDITITPGSNVVAEGTFTLDGSNWVTVTPSDYQAGDVPVACYQSGDDSSPQLLILKHKNATSFEVAGDSADACVYAYKVLR